MKPSAAIFVSKEGTATFWFFVAAAAVVGSCIYTQRLLAKTALRPQYIIMMSDDVKPLRFDPDPAELAKRDEAQTRLLMDSVFNRAPNGLDAELRCRKLMSDEAWDWVQKELVEKQADAFRDGRIHQKVEIESISFRRVPEQDAVIASVSGQLIRTGIFDGRLFNEVWSVKADALWLPNTSLLEQGRIPTICHRFSCKETPIASTLRRTLDSSSQIPPASPTPDAAPN